MTAFGGSLGRWVFLSSFPWPSTNAYASGPQLLTRSTNGSFAIHTHSRAAFAVSGVASGPNLRKFSYCESSAASLAADRSSSPTARATVLLLKTRQQIRKHQAAAGFESSGPGALACLMLASGAFYCLTHKAPAGPARCQATNAYFRPSATPSESSPDSAAFGSPEPPLAATRSAETPMWRSFANRPLTKKLHEALIFSGGSNAALGEAVAERLSTKLGAVRVGRFADGEVNIQFLESLRGKDVYIIQPTSTPVNDHLMELLLMISTCRRASAKKITAVIPYFGYARQDRKLNSRVPISAADVARMMEAMGVDRVVAVDLHCGQIQGFFGPLVPVDNVEAQIIGLDYFKQKELQKPIVVSPDAGGVYRAKKFQDGLVNRGHPDCGIAMLIKQRVRVNEVESMELVGKVEGSDVIIVDDMIDTAGTLCEAARELKKKGARNVYAFATHGLFSDKAIQKIEDSPLVEVVVTDSVKARPSVSDCSKITSLSISVLLADAIRRIHQKESLNDLFNFQPCATG